MSSGQSWQGVGEANRRNGQNPGENSGGQRLDGEQGEWTNGTMWQEAHSDWDTEIHPGSDPGKKDQILWQKDPKEEILKSTNLVSTLQFRQHNDHLDFSLEDHLPEVTDGLFQRSLSCNHHFRFPVTL